MRNHKYNQETSASHSKETMIHRAVQRKERMQSLPPAHEFFATANLGDGDNSHGDGINHDQEIQRLIRSKKS